MRPESSPSMVSERKETFDFDLYEKDSSLLLHVILMSNFLSLFAYIYMKFIYIYVTYIYAHDITHLIIEL